MKHPRIDPAALFSVAGKRILVTGGGAGIGFMIARGLLDAGARVYVCGRTEATLAKAEPELKAHGEAYLFQADVATDEGVARIRHEIEAREDRLHVLINNVGISARYPLGRFPRDEYNRILNTNVSSAFQTVQALHPLLRAAATPEDPARVINISSIGARKIMPLDNFAYSASKSALDTLTRHLGAELAPQHINVNAIACGLFRTEGSGYLFDPDDPRSKNRPNIPLDRPGETEDIVGAVLYLASRASAYVTGVRIPVAGGQSTVDWERPDAG